MSNFLRRPDFSGPPPKCRPAEPAEIHHALRFVLGSGNSLADHQQVAEFVGYARERGINVGEIWLAERDRHIVWAVLPILSPGRTMLVLAPWANVRDNAPGLLLDAVSNSFSARGVHLAQALLDPADTTAERLFAAHGFARMAELIYLQGGVPRNTAVPILPEGFGWKAYSSQTHDLFAATIIASYRDSLDCPGLNGLRDISDVLAGHKASGEFNPNHWFVLHDQGKGVGVLLLSRLPTTDSAELVYLGVAPDARGHGIANLLMRQAFITVSAMGQARLSLAVDSTNVPALKLYYRAGMAKAGSKIAMMKKL